MNAAAFVVNLLTVVLCTGAGVAVAVPLGWTCDDLIARLDHPEAFTAWWWQ